MLPVFRASFTRMLKCVTVLVCVLYLSVILLHDNYVNRSLFHFKKIRHIPVNGSGKVFTAAAAAETVSLKNWFPKTGKFLVDSKKCKILNVNPFHISIKHLLKLNKEADTCDDRKELTYIRGNTLFLNQTKKPKGLSYCRLKPIYRKKDSYEFGKRSKPFNRFIDIKNEFIKVECYNFFGDVISENYHMHFIIKVKNNFETNNSSKQSEDSNTTRNVNSKTNAQSTVLSNKKSLFEIKDRLNVLLIMIDSASRINSLRHLPKTRQYLTDTLGAVEMLGYNKVADNTMPNMVALLTGDYYENQPCLDSKQGVDNCSFIWKNYAKAGYLTHFTEDLSTNGLFHFTLKGFKRQPTDYYDRPFHKANEKGYTKRDICMHGKSSSEKLHQRMYDLAYNLRNKHYFSFSQHIRMSHDYLEGLRNLDTITLNTFSKLFENDLLNNTFLAFFGDHGIRFGNVRTTFIGQLEERLPMMFIYVPKWFKTKYSNLIINLERNARRLTTHFDTFSTLLHLLDQDHERTHNYGISLFHEIPHERSCVDAGISPHWCTCNYHLFAMDNNTMRNNLASFFIFHLNSLLKNHEKMCSKLNLKSIVSSVKLLSRDVTHSKHRVIIETEPGDGMFEATLKCNKICSKYNVIGDVSRVNEYGSSSKCIKDHTLRKICHCIDPLQR